MTWKALRTVAGLTLAGVTAFTLAYGSQMATATRAEAGMCYDLWYQRNAIFANKGYCFKGCGRRVWGSNCFPPYGKLTGTEWSRVKQIQAQERAIGCPKCPEGWQ